MNEKIKNVIAILLTVVLTGTGYYILMEKLYPIDYDLLGGVHSWLSGSTIKFVNNWLQEGACNLKFICYEAPQSIEYMSLIDRAPYMSYPMSFN